MKFLIGHSWTIRNERKPILMYGIFDNLKSFERMQKHEEERTGSLISLVSTEIYNETEK